MNTSLRTLFLAGLVFAAGGQRATAEAPEGSASASATLLPADLPPGHSAHGQAFNEGPRQRGFLMEGTGRVHFPIRSSHPDAQRWFDQGVGQLHGFWYFEAERAFRQVVALDRQCLLGYWGLAMATRENADRARGFLRKAWALREQADRRERLWLDALWHYFEVSDEKLASDPPTESPPAEKKPAGATADDSLATAPAATAASPDTDTQQPAPNPQAKDTPADDKPDPRRQRLIRDLEAIVQEFPEDLEAKAFLAWAIWDGEAFGHLPISSHQAVDALLQQIEAVEPMHPGLHHYRIHLWDKEQARRAIPSAAQAGPAAPAIAHMWHMAGHIYAQLHRYADSAWQQEAAARVDHAYMHRDRVLPYQIHNYAHNSEWLARNLCHLGQPQQALAVAKNLIEIPQHPARNRLGKDGSCASFGRLRLLETCERYRLWHELLALVDSPYLPTSDDSAVQARLDWSLGLAYASLGQADALSAQRERLAQLRAALDAPPTSSPAADATTATAPSSSSDKTTAEEHAKLRDKTRKLLDGAEVELATAADLLAGKRAEALARLHTDAAGEIPKIRKARWLLDAGDSDAATRLAREAVADNPSQVDVLARQIEIFQILGKDTEATAAWEQLAAMAATAELDTPLLERLTPLARTLGKPADWRTPAAAPDDLGLRPELSSLGPYAWQPQPMTNWSLPDVLQQTHTAASLHGRPYVILLYLGFDCSHCVEQLEAFAARREEFSAAGIELVAVGTQSPERAAAALAARQAEQRPELPFLFLCDADATLFRSVRAFDNFEEAPLHSTILVDGQGRVRWQDVAYQPFMDVKFLIPELRRLLSLPPVDGATVATTSALP